MHCHSLSKVSLLLLSIGAYWVLFGSVCSGNDKVAKGVDSGYSAAFQRRKKPRNLNLLFILWHFSLHLGEFLLSYLKSPVLCWLT